MLERYLSESPTISAKLQVPVSHCFQGASQGVVYSSIISERKKKMAKRLDNWQNSWDHVQASKGGDAS
jgi:hypothetical protein